MIVLQNARHYRILSLCNKSFVASLRFYKFSAMQKFLLFIAIIALFASCSESSSELKTGHWRGVIGLQGQRLPFQFDIERDSSGSIIAFIQNASERIKLDEIHFFGDSISFVLHIFDAQLRVKNHGDSLTGYYTKDYVDDYKIPFVAYYNQHFRFPTGSPAHRDFSGKYDVTFTSKNESKKAVGVFEQNGNSVTGTFLLKSGDYRYLEGNVVGDTLRLSTFDGNHAYFFKAAFDGDSLVGEYWSGKTYYATWTGIRDDSAALPDPESQTYMKEGYDRIEFSFPTLSGDSISLRDPDFQNKIVILQLFGTWCPNCMDETIFLRDWYNKNRDRGIEIIGLAYEQKADYEYARNRVLKMKERLKVNYPMLIAGTSDNDEASKTLPMLNRVAAFPTMIIIGRDGKVRHIHTGFTGPGTGIYYEQFQERFNEVMNELLAENPPS